MSQNELDFQDPLIEYQEAFDKLEDRIKDYPENFKEWARTRLRLDLLEGRIDYKYLHDNSLVEIKKGIDFIKSKIDFDNAYFQTSEDEFGDIIHYIRFYKKPDRVDSLAMANEVFTEMNKRHMRDKISYDSLKRTFEENVDLMDMKMMRERLEKYEKESTK